MLQKYEIFIRDSTDFTENQKVPGGPFLDPDNQETYVFDKKANVNAGGHDTYDKGRGYVWPYGMENWVNLEGKYMHIVADMSAYTDSATVTDTVSVCTLGIYGTKYVRDEPLPSSATVM